MRIYGFLLIIYLWFTQALLPSIFTLKRNDSIDVVDSWIKVIKMNNMPSHVISPMYTTAGRLKIIDKCTDQFLTLGCAQSFFNPFKNDTDQDTMMTHLCIGRVKGLNKDKITKPTFYLEQVLYNPDLLILDEVISEVTSANYSVNFRHCLEDHIDNYGYTLDQSNLELWDNGRYYLLMNEDRILTD